MLDIGILDLVFMIIAGGVFFALQNFAGTKTYPPLKKYGVALGFGLGAILVAIACVNIFTGLPENDMTKQELFTNHGDIFAFGLSSAQFLTKLGIWLMGGSLLYYLVDHAKQSINVVAAVVGVIVIYFLSQFVFASGDFIPEIEEAIRKGKVAPMAEADMQFVDGSIVMAYIMLLLGIVVAVFSSIIGFIKQ